MNIFFLSTDPRFAAQAHCDKHVLKMIVESAQLLSAAHHFWRPAGDDLSQVYKLTHPNHPCTIWVQKAKANYDWLYELFIELQSEYTYRYGRIHACSRLNPHLRLAPHQHPCIKGMMTPPALAMPERYRERLGFYYPLEDAVKAYREYYIHEKASFARWTTRAAPDWFLDAIIPKEVTQ